MSDIPERLRAVEVAFEERTNALSGEIAGIKNEVGVLSGKVEEVSENLIRMEGKIDAMNGRLLRESMTQKERYAFWGAVFAAVISAMALVINTYISVVVAG